MIDLSIIIVNWNTRDLLHQCLETVFAIVHGLSIEVWVVDNASTDGSAKMVRESFPEVLLIENPQNLGFARANNQAVERCLGRYALLLNSDAFLGVGAAVALFGALQADPRAGIAGARLVYPDGRAQRSYSCLPSLLGEVGSLLGMDKVNTRVGKKGKGEVKEVGAVSGACLMARRAMLVEIGLLDERFFMFSEEIDLCKRAWAAGWKVLHVPAARVVHVAGGSSGLTSGRVLQLYRGKLQYFEKHYGLRTCRVLFAAMRYISQMKVWFYALINPSKATLWRTVHKGLTR